MSFASLPGEAGYRLRAWGLGAGAHAPYVGEDVLNGEGIKPLE